MHLPLLLLFNAITGLDNIDDVPDIDLPLLEYDLKIIKIDLLEPFELLFNWFAEAIFDTVKMPFYAIKGLFLVLNEMLKSAGIGAPALYLAIFLTITIVLALVVAVIKIIIPII